MTDEGAILYPTFPCRRRDLSPRRLSSPAPLGNPIAPSSVTFGDSFPPRGSLWVVQPYTKKRPKSGHVHGHRNSPTIAPLRPTTPKRASGNERAINQGGAGGIPPATLCVRAFSRESLDPPPGTGREPTSQGPTCDGPDGTTCRRHTRPARRSWARPFSHEKCAFVPAQTERGRIFAFLLWRPKGAALRR